MAHESPEVDRGREDASPSLPSVPSGQEDSRRVQDGIKRLAESRTRQNLPLEQLRKLFEGIRGQIALVIAEDKRLRIERSRLNVYRDRLRSKVLELRKLRVSRESHASQSRTRLKEYRAASTEDGASEMVHLESRADELREDVDAMEETLRVHRRDRKEVLAELMYARDELQDTLTEALLWRIQALDAKPGAGGRRGQAGVTAEFLGRLLVLEKEQAQICGIIARRCSLPSKKGENEKGISG